MSTFDIIANLPIDIIPSIVKYVPRLTDLIHYQRVSKTWRSVFSNPIAYAELVNPVSDCAYGSGIQEAEYDNAYWRFVKMCYDQHSIMTLNLSKTRVCHLGSRVTNQISRSAHSKDYLVLYLQHDRRFLVWDFTAEAEDDMEPKVLEFGTNEVKDMIISDEGGYLIWQESDKAAMFVFKLASAFERSPVSRPGNSTDMASKARGIQVFPFPEGYRLSGLSPFNCDGEHLVARFGVDVGSPKKIIIIWDIQTNKLISKFPFSQSGLWETSSILNDKKIYLFSLPLRRSEDLRMFPFPGYCKTYDFSGKVTSSVGVLPGTEFRFSRMFEPTCSDGKIHYVITRQGGLYKGHCLSTMVVDENTGLGHERKFYPACGTANGEADPYSTETYYPVQECITQKESQCLYLFHGISDVNGVCGEIEIWDTTSNKSRRYILPKVRAVFANETFFCKCVNRDLYIHRYARWDEQDQE